MRASDEIEFSQLLMGWAEVFDKTPSSDAIDAWFSSLKDLSIDQIKQAGSAHLNDSSRGRFMPTISDIRYQLKQLPRDAHDADSQAEDHSKKMPAGGWPNRNRQIKKLLAAAKTAYGSESGRTASGVRYESARTMGAVMAVLGRNRDRRNAWLRGESADSINNWPQTEEGAWVRSHS